MTASPRKNRSKGAKSKPKPGGEISGDMASVRAPSQVRSRASMETLLDIGKRLIEERGIDDCSMNDVAAAAGSSIGSLYFRFGNRERFISEVMQRQIEAARQDFARIASDVRDSAQSPDRVVLAVVGWLVRIFSENQGLLRSQLRRALEKPEVWRPFQDLAREVVGGTVKLLSTSRQIKADRDWEMHVRIAMQIVIGTLNNILINKPGPLELNEPGAAEELATVVIRYLQLTNCGDDLAA
jgi:AcrR family transcriptional regulator